MVDTPWRRTVVVVGAGATLAEALPSRPSGAKTPPLDATFFDLCNQLDAEGRGTLAAYMSNAYGIEPFAHSPGMEEVFNLVYADTHSAGDGDAALNAYWALVKLYREAIRVTTNPLTGTSRSGIGRLLRFLMAKGQPERRIRIVTFNQDLVIEKALQAMAETGAYSHVSWSLDSIYGLEFSDVIELAARGRPFRTGPVEPDYRVALHKLHGSLNWVYPVRSVDDAKNALRDPSQEVYCLNDQDIRKEVRVQGEAKSRQMLPLIVPPIYEKSAVIRSFLRPAWESAGGALRNSDEIIIFGYSLPPADVAATGLLRRAFFQNEDRVRVGIVNPDFSAAARIADVLGAEGVRMYRDIAALERDWSAS